MELGNLSEIVAAVAVIISIIYLAIQVRDNTRATVLTATRELSDRAQAAGTANAVDGEIADIWLIGVRDRKRLSHRDGFRFSQTVWKIFSSWEQQYFHLEEKLIHRKLFESQLEAYRAALVWPGIRDWWKNNRGGFSAEFRDHVDQLVEDTEVIAPDNYESERSHADA